MIETFLTSSAVFTVHASRAQSYWLTISRIFVRSQVSLTFLATIIFISWGNFSKVKVAINVPWVLFPFQMMTGCVYSIRRHHKIFWSRECHRFLPLGVCLTKALIWTDVIIWLFPCWDFSNFHGCRLSMVIKKCNVEPHQLKSI